MVSCKPKNKSQYDRNVRMISSMHFDDTIDVQTEKKKKLEMVW